MTTYNTETVSTQFLNQSFINKLENGMEKEASVAASAFVRQRLREDGFLRKVLPPVSVTAAELDRQITEEPIIIVEKEPDTTAATLPFLARAPIRYWKTARYPVGFQKLSSADFRKSKWELATYRTDIRTILQENSVKDIQTQEDTSFYNNVKAIAAANSNVFTVAGGFNKANFLNGVKKLVEKKLPVGCIVMTQSMYNDLLSFPGTDIGSPAASDLFMGRTTLESIFGYKIITTNKNDLVATNEMLVFAPPAYLGQMFELQAPTLFLKVEQDIIEFVTYESIGVGIGNTNACISVSF